MSELYVYLDKILETPRDDGVVVEGDIESHDPTGQAETSQVGSDLRSRSCIDLIPSTLVNLFPHSYRSFSQPLTYCQLQDEEREAEKEQGEDVGNQKCS